MEFAQIEERIAVDELVIRRGEHHQTHVPGGGGQFDGGEADSLVDRGRFSRGQGVRIGELYRTGISPGSLVVGRVGVEHAHRGGASVGVLAQTLGILEDKGLQVLAQVNLDVVILSRRGAAPLAVEVSSKVVVEQAFDGAFAAALRVGRELGGVGHDTEVIEEIVGRSGRGIVTAAHVRGAGRRIEFAQLAVQAVLFNGVCDRVEEVLIDGTHFPAVALGGQVGPPYDFISVDLRVQTGVVAYGHDVEETARAHIIARAVGERIGLLGLSRQLDTAVVRADIGAGSVVLQIIGTVASVLNLPHIVSAVEIRGVGRRRKARGPEQIAAAGVHAVRRALADEIVVLADFDSDDSVVGCLNGCGECVVSRVAGFLADVGLNAELHGGIVGRLQLGIGRLGYASGRRSLLEVGHAVRHQQIDALQQIVAGRELAYRRYRPLVRVRVNRHER